jgi:hypothetical protein
MMMCLKTLFMRKSCCYTEGSFIFYFDVQSRTSYLKIVHFSNHALRKQALFSPAPRPMFPSNQG